MCKLCMVNLMDIRPKAKRIWLPEYGILAKRPYCGGAVPLVGVIFPTVTLSHFSTSPNVTARFCIFGSP